MDAQHDIVAVGLLTRSQLDLLGSDFTSFIPVADLPLYDDLLAHIEGAVAEEIATHRRP